MPTATPTPVDAGGLQFDRQRIYDRAWVAAKDALEAERSFEERLVQASRMAATAESQRRSERLEANELAGALAAGGYRGVYKLSGLGRSRLGAVRREALGGESAPRLAGSQRVDRQKYAELAEQHHITPATAATQQEVLRRLVRSATADVQMRAIAAAAREVRDVAASGLVEAGVPRSKVAQLAGLSMSWLSGLVPR